MSDDESNGDENDDQESERPTFEGQFIIDSGDEEVSDSELTISKPDKNSDE